MPQDSVSRRDLAKHLAMGTGAAVLGLSPAPADDTIADAPSPLDTQMAWLFERYPSEHLTEEQTKGIRRDVERRIAQSARLRQFPLEPADAPALVFAAYRAEG